MAETKPVAKRRHWCFMDWLRLYGFAVVFAYHAVVKHRELFAASSHPWLMKAWEAVCSWNVGISVGLFFMASGMGLMLSASRNDFSVKAFYRRRFTALLIPFYLAWVFGLLLRLPGSVRNMASVGAPVRSFLLTVTALDGFAAVRYGIPSWYQVGEWFLGTLVLLYLVFPLMRAACRRQPQVFLAAVCVLCIAADVLLVRFGQKEPSVSPLSRGLLFGAGMYLAEESRRGRAALNAGVIFGLTMVWILPGLSPDAPGTDILQQDIRSLAIFSGAMLAEPLLAKAGRLNEGIRAAAGLTYALYLTHHVILEAVDRWLPAGGSLPRLAAGIVLAAAASVLAAVLLQKAANAVTAGLTARKREK